MAEGSCTSCVCISDFDSVSLYWDSLYMRLEAFNPSGIFFMYVMQFLCSLHMLDLFVVAFSLVYLNCLSYISYYNGSEVHTQSAVGVQNFGSLHLPSRGHSPSRRPFHPGAAFHYSNVFTFLRSFPFWKSLIPSQKPQSSILQDLCLPLCSFILSKFITM